MRKNIAIIFIFMCIIICLFGCESLKYTAMRVTKFPDNIVYIVDNSMELELCSGELEIELSNGKTLYTTSMCDSNLYIESTIDFDTPGVYEITIYVRYGNPISVKFAVQVIDENIVKNIGEK
jgi:hypothetical protein